MLDFLDYKYTCQKFLTRMENEETTIEYHDEVDEEYLQEEFPFVYGEDTIEEYEE